ncbi:MAG TPA: TfoX/Sxy family protein [Anaerolineales bacterium]|jgi:TfoX/Sxy family transcriptional regulator of competence genes|nr:TfoX/Sxy family protein [Anaerolineales bacterium]
MAYDEVLVQRVKEQLKGKKGIVEKKMFGGVAFLMNGNMAVGVNKDDLIVRVNANQHDQLLKKMSVRTFDLSRGRPMKGWLLIAPMGVKADKDLRNWLQLGINYARSLPAK